MIIGETAISPQVSGLHSGLELLRTIPGQLVEAGVEATLKHWRSDFEQKGVVFHA